MRPYTGVCIAFFALYVRADIKGEFAPPAIEIAAGTYQNPVGPANTGDPGAIYDPATNAFYFAITSGDDPEGFPIYKSSTLGDDWVKVGAVFPPGRWPTWAVKDLWAPELHQTGDGVWRVYFVARNGNGTLSVGVASSTSSSILGPYSDLGHELVAAWPGHIDPTFYREEETGQQYLIYKEDGNAYVLPNGTSLPTPLYLVTLSEDGLNITSSPLELLRNNHSSWESNLIEAPWVVKRGGWYYLFYSGNWEVNYAIGVARSQSITGPYVKYWPPILHTNSSSAFQGSGHCSVITDPHTGNDVMLYHSWQPANGPRFVMLDAVQWSSDTPIWPFVANGYPSTGVQAIP